MSFFSQRSSELEIMDDLDCEGPVLEQTLRELKTINRWLGGNHVTTLGLTQLIHEKPQKQYEITDIGCGGGDMIRVMSKWAQKHEIPAKFTGIDANGNIIEFAKVRQSDLSAIKWKIQNVFEPEFAAEKTDLITCTLFTHHFTDGELVELLKAMKAMMQKGFRVLGVGVSDFSGTNYPETQQALKFNFKGLVAFYDPPKHNIQAVFETFYKAGIQVKIVTGDNAETTSTIAKQVGFKNADKVLNGDELMAMDEATLKEKVMKTTIFTRMFPEAKLKIIQALKANNQIVAMTGDGVNDGPALKSAHIGIAMGKKGTEIAKQAANLILIDDNFERMTDAIAMGRKIYINLKKAIQYIISIHIPIILIVFIPLALGWMYPNIFTPVHIIFLEIIMGPTCSIIYENEPMEDNLMLQKPRPLTTTFFNLKEVLISIIQGLVITLGLLFIYQYAIGESMSENGTRTLIFLTLITSNIVLTLANRSFYYSIFKTIQYKNNLVGLIIGITILLTGLLLFIPAFSNFFLFEMVSGSQIGLCVLVGSISVLWVEIYKAFKRKKTA